MEFDDFTIDLTALELRRRGVRVELSPQAVRLLSVLVERRGELVARHELYRSLWPGDQEIDVDRSLNTLIRQIRQALGDTPTTPRYIRTYPRRGYRFLGGAGRPIRRRLPVGTLLLILGVMAGVVTGRRRDPDSTIPQAARESFELGRYLLESSEISRRGSAVSYFMEAVRIAPNSARARAHLADALLWAGRAADAEKEARRALALDPHEPHALFIGGVLALIRDWDWRRAESWLRLAASRDRNQVSYPVVLAYVLSTAGRKTEALAFLDRARAQNPASAILTADIGLMYLYAGEPGMAALVCEEVLRIAPDAGYALDCALAARLALDDPDAACRHALGLIRLAGEEPTTVLGDSAESADSTLARFRRWQGDRASGYLTTFPFQAALAFAMSGRVTEAVDALQQAAASRDMGIVTITVDPRFAVLRDDLAFLRIAAPLVQRGAAPPTRR